MALKAVYGLRRSPKVWGDHRDSVLRDMEWEVEGKRMRLNQCIAEPNMWRIIKEEDATEPSQEGLMMVSVDDALILSKDGVVNGLISRRKKTWELSNPEWFGEDAPVRFLGMDLHDEEEGWEHFHFSRSLHIYIYVLKRRGEEKGSISGSPVTRDQAQRIEEPQSTTPTLDEVKQAQRITGELMWLRTRSRPDLMYVMSKMRQKYLEESKRSGWSWSSSHQVFEEDTSTRSLPNERERRSWGLHRFELWSRRKRFSRHCHRDVGRSYGDVEVRKTTTGTIVHCRKGASRKHRRHDHGRYLRCFDPGGGKGPLHQNVEDRQHGSGPHHFVLRISVGELADWIGWWRLFQTLGRKPYLHQGWKLWRRR